MTNSLDPHQDSLSKSPDPNCLQRFNGYFGSEDPDEMPQIVAFHLHVGQHSLLVLLLYVPSQQLWSLRDGQFT